VRIRGETERTTSRSALGHTRLGSARLDSARLGSTRASSSSSSSSPERSVVFSHSAVVSVSLRPPRFPFDERSTGETFDRRLTDAFARDCFAQRAPGWKTVLGGVVLLAATSVVAASSSTSTPRR